MILRILPIKENLEFEDNLLLLTSSIISIRCGEELAHLTDWDSYKFIGILYLWSFVSIDFQFDYRRYDFLSLKMVNFISMRFRAEKYEGKRATKITPNRKQAK